jgi:hypothetical protein
MLRFCIVNQFSRIEQNPSCIPCIHRSLDTRCRKYVLKNAGLSWTLLAIVAILYDRRLYNRSPALAECAPRYLVRIKPAFEYLDQIVVVRGGFPVTNMRIMCEQPSGISFNAQKYL